MFAVTHSRARQSLPLYTEIFVSKDEIGGSQVDTVMVAPIPVMRYHSPVAMHLKTIEKKGKR